MNEAGFLKSRLLPLQLESVQNSPELAKDAKLESSPEKILGTDPWKKEGQKEKVQVSHQVALYRHHQRAHFIRFPQAPCQHHQKISEDPENENVKKSNTELNILKR